MICARRTSPAPSFCERVIRTSLCASSSLNARTRRDIATSPARTGARITLQTRRSRSLLAGCTTKARFSLVREPVGDDENAGCCQQRIDDDGQPVVAAIEALVGEQPSIGVLDDAANGAQPGAVRLAPLADQRQDALGRAKSMVLGAVICGIGVEPGDRGADHQSAAQ